ncbi:pyridoxamine 5'-phosphate oxidase family protein [Microbacterium sp.]|uniref:pyridoxamine 5'-phosphate oxidase family protein n=1 Tax=Microbacterium sp. TaxID=51671 RepID=UPI0026140CAC|nr:pyridoxamine 5'-phosphate oxidase family protein [uncultured Microbacterium sp.]
MIDILDESECFALLGSTTVGRVGIMRSGRIEIIPVNYRLDGRDVLLRTKAEGALAGLPDEPTVAFEVDHHDDLAGTGWNVLLNGTVRAMTPDEVSSMPGALRVRPWAGGERELWLRFTADQVSGRRVRRSQA